ncbi:MAG: UDP-N-acetylglucosamine 2-epimerase (non-hydrolyzing) [Chlorobi bacterium CHB2]|nr:UDP-N-acetylglucosamine 2-epimerase (non-hydrolyzing) [Chlorobi bacterium CHB2]
MAPHRSALDCSSMNLLFVLGTRPEAVKVAPVIAAFRAQGAWANVQTLLTDQHRDMVEPILRLFDITPDIRLNLMRKGQRPLPLAARVMAEMDRVLSAMSPDLVVVQGDTTSAMGAAMAAFHHKIPVAHIEAGLRTDDRYSPFPEEMNRRIITQLATLHFAATNANRDRLLAENVPAPSIAVTGNPVIDTLQRITSTRPPAAGTAPSRRTILLTTHRRENFGTPQANILKSVGLIVERFADVEVVVPVHPNPEVRRAVRQHLPSHPRIHQIAPLNYPEFIQLMARAFLVMTDSGGVQEEAPALGKPVIVLRTETEREEVVESGNGMMVPLESEAIASAVAGLLTDAKLYRRMSRKAFPFGKGNAAAKIVREVKKWAKGLGG